MIYCLFVASPYNCLCMTVADSSVANFFRKKKSKVESAL